MPGGSDLGRGASRSGSAPLPETLIFQFVIQERDYGQDKEYSG